MKKFLLILCALLGTVGAWATDYTIFNQEGGTFYDYYGKKSGSQSWTSGNNSGISGFTITLTGNNVTLDKSGNWALIVHSSASETSYTMTLQAPAGYIITGYELISQIYSSNNPNSYVLTASNGTTQTVNSTTLKTLSVTGLCSSSTDISIVAAEAANTTQRWFTMKKLVVSLERMSDHYEAAKGAITDNTYRIKTNVSGTDYYVTTGGALTSDKGAAGYFNITQTSGGNYGTGFRIDTGSERFTNPPLSNNVANLKPGNYAHSNGDRADWERQILYLNSEGKYAIRSCNVADATSSWGDAGRTHWTYYMVEDVVTPCYSYNPDYIWEFEVPPVIVNVTYKLVESDGTTEVSSATVKQEANSAIATHLPGTGMDYNGFWHENFSYTYATEGTIGSTDCTIKIIRTEKAGVVKALSELSNTKAYYIGCDRGAMIAYNGSMVNTALQDATANAQPYGKFALLNYEDNYYIYSVDEGKFIRNNAALSASLIEDGFSEEDAIKIDPKTAPYFLWYFNIGGTNNGLNTNGNAPLGYVINTWMNADQGNQYYMVEAEDFDPTAALAELEAYFHPSYLVTYNIKDEFGTQIATFPNIPAAAGQHITTLPIDYQRNNYTYNEVDVTIADLETTIEFTATWNGPFKISKDFANAQWQNMAIRGTWYVTSAIKEDGAYKTQNANTMGLVEDSYQWAFIAVGYGDGIKVINKAEGDGKSFGYGDDLDSGSIPTIMDDSEGHHVWKIVASTNTTVPANSFCLGVPGTNLYINQYGGAGGSLKFWNTTGNIGDEGSAFTIFDVPTDFAEFFVTDLAPEFDATGYFALTDAAKTAIGYDPAFKTTCTFTDYSTMKNALATAKNDITNFVLPETGYYLLKNKYYGTYMGIDPADKNLYGNYNSADQPKHIVKLTKTGAATYTISLEGVFAPATVAQSQSVTAADEAGTYTVSVPTVGYAAFKAAEAQYSALHCAGGGEIVGWEAPADASQWAALDATSVNIAISEAGYATTYLPFAVTIPGGVTAYAVSSIDANILELTAISTTIPAETPVILEGDEGTYIFAITTSDPYGETNLLTGTLTQKDAEDGNYILQNQEGNVGFYLVDTNEAQPKIPANRAYFETALGQAGVKAFFFNGGDTDAIKSVFSGIAEGKIFDLSGRKVAKMQKGNTYIVNGKKVNVK